MGQAIKTFDEDPFEQSPAPAVDYQALETDKAHEIELRIRKELNRQIGPHLGELRQGILQLVANNEYDSAVDELQLYVDHKTKYPLFQQRVETYVRHCKNLIYAIQAKRNFPSSVVLSYARQQELSEKVREHFEELKHYLKKIERVEREVKLDDMRSTVWVLKTLTYCLFALFALGFFLDLKAGMANSFFVAFHSLVDLLTGVVSSALFG